MKSLLILQMLLLLFFCACSKEQKDLLPPVAELKIYHEWMYAFKVNNLVNSPEIIKRPPGIDQLLLSLTLPSESGAGFKTHCLYYRVPYKKIEGQLTIDTLKDLANCPLTSSDSPWLRIIGIKDLRLKMENFHLMIDYTLKGKAIAWNFMMPNLEAGITHERYQPQKEKRLYPGMVFLKVNEETFDQNRNFYLGKLSDRFGRGSSIRCLQMDKSCHQIGEDRCDECRYGWYQVVDYSCPQGGSRFCGQNHCGEKNEPACIRGTKIVESEDLGICQSDLSPVWNADHILICQ